MPSFRTTSLLTLATAALFALPTLAAAAVLFTEDYESVNWENRWSVPNWASDGVWERITNDANVFNGNGSLRVRMGLSTGLNDEKNVSLRHMLQDNSHERLFMRWYEMVEDGPVFNSNHYSVGLKGNSLYGWSLGKSWPQNFDESNPKYTLRVSRNRPVGVAFMYGYTGGGNEDIEQNRYPGGFNFQPNEWNCYEIELDGNTIGRNDGNLRFWANNKLVQEQTGIFLRGQDQMKIQAIENLFKLRIHSYNTSNAPDPTVTFWQDDIVVSTERIGCGGTVPQPVPTPGPCSRYLGGIAAPSPYGVAWNWLSSGKELLLSLTCESSSTNNDRQSKRQSSLEQCRTNVLLG